MVGLAVSSRRALGSLVASVQLYSSMQVHSRPVRVTGPLKGFSSGSISSSVGTSIRYVSTKKLERGRRPICGARVVPMCTLTCQALCLRHTVVSRAIPLFIVFCVV